MRVLHITSGDLWGGAEAQLYSLVRELQRTGDVVPEVLLFNDGLTMQRLQASALSVTVIDEAQHGTLGLLRRIVEFMRRTRPDIVHMHGYKECVLGSTATLLAGGIPCVRTVHGWVEKRARFWQLKGILVRFAELLTMHWQRAVVAVSAELGSRLSRYLDNGNVVVIENGIELVGLQTSLSPVQVQQRDAPLRIAIVGRLVPVKRIDVFLRVCRLLQNDFGSRIQFFVIGDGPMMPEVRRQVQELGLVDQTRLPGFVQDVRAHLAGLDALLITSDHEGLPMTLLEAMAQKVPVVAHAVGGIPVALEDGNCGWLVHRQEPHDYYQAVHDILQNKVETQRKTANAYHRIVSRYSASQVARRYLELYHSIVATGRPANPK